MAYLTNEEYRQMGYDSLNEPEFTNLLNKASAVLDNVTRRFYVFNELEKDYEFRKNAFKQAVACQMHYFVETGETTSEGLNNMPQNLSMGRTSLTFASNYSATGKNESKSLLSDDVYIYLEGTGLFYRGVCS
ncbi:hypothetical protein [Listeria valentina]|uniref:hypothetical protein n=1 Tax=Listeria valentina TaxID=2705293 RepID=UPI0014306C49|nr:hypothetical protein [Listeria valentina]